MDKELRNYLKDVVALEKSVYSQTQTIDRMEEEISKLGHWQEYNEPKKPYTYEINVFEGISGFLSGGATVGGIIGFFAGSFGGIIMGIFIGGLLGGVLCMMINGGAESAENKSRQEDYELRVAVHKALVEADNERVTKELIEKDRLREILAMMEGKREESLNLLQQYYATDIIFPKYRNLIAMCSICEYFLSGATDTLKEAYNKYDNEVLFKAVLTKLDEVVQSLESIKENQYMLYDAIQEGNRISQRLVDEAVNQAKLIEKSIDFQKLQASYSAQLVDEVRFQNQLVLYDTWQRNRD